MTDQQKKDYTPPKLVRHGTVAQLTQTGANGGLEPGPGTKRRPSIP